MDEQRFDDLSRLIATKTSRRQVLKVLVGATVGGLFIRSGSGTAFAVGPGKCHRTGLGCDTNSDCCSGNCVNGRCAAATTCTYSPCSHPGGSFAGGTLTCGSGETCVPGPSGITYAGNVCTCGAIPGVNDCPSGTTCYSGQCFPSVCQP